MPRFCLPLVLCAPGGGGHAILGPRGRYSLCPCGLIKFGPPRPNSTSPAHSEKVENWMCGVCGELMFLFLGAQIFLHGDWT